MGCDQAAVLVQRQSTLRSAAARRREHHHPHSESVALVRTAGCPCVHRFVSPTGGRSCCREGHNGGVSDAGSDETADAVRGRDRIHPAAPWASAGPGPCGGRVADLAGRAGLDRAAVSRPESSTCCLRAFSSRRRKPSSSSPSSILGEPRRATRGSAVRRRITLAVVIVMPIDNLAAVIEMVLKAITLVPQMAAPVTARAERHHRITRRRRARPRHNENHLCTALANAR